MTTCIPPISIGNNGKAFYEVTTTSLPSIAIGGNDIGSF